MASPFGTLGTKSFRRQRGDKKEARTWADQGARTRAEREALDFSEQKVVVATFM